MILQPTSLTIEFLINCILEGKEFKSLKFFVNKKTFKKIAVYYKGQSFINKDSELEFFDFGKYFKEKPRLKKINILKKQKELADNILDFKFF